ncbi:hypothetical protein JB92DRAFT_3091411 [Gautieria morchelliformis]|nr:hypothetical protein JB92DRAFT_3091411 [Gautieria morchelliformis]
MSPPPIFPLVALFLATLVVGVLPRPALDSLRVPVLLGVMSRCPDALLCESVFDGVLKQTWDIVDITLSFVGKLNNADPDFGVTCKHGVAECRGNVQELCAMHVANTPQDWWNFVQCLNFEGKEDVGDPGLAERCAGLTYIPWYDMTDGTSTRMGIKSCAEGQQGKDLLKASVTQTEHLGIKTSCSIMISGKTRCIHDGTWKKCETGHSVEELVGYIQNEHQRLNGHGTSVEDE